MQSAIDKLLARNSELELENETWNRVSNSEGSIEMSAVAKLLNFKGLGRNKIFAILRDMQILRSNNEPYQQYVDSGHFDVIEQEKEVYEGYTITNRKTVVTQKGIDYISKKLQEQGHEFANR